VTVKISAQLSDKKRPDANGLDAIEDEMLADKLGEGRWVAIVELRTMRISNEIMDGGKMNPTAAIMSIEVMQGDNVNDARRMKRETYTARTGQSEIPGIDGESTVDRTVSTDPNDPFYGGPLKGEDDAQLIVEPTDDGPTSERSHDDWLGDK
jgi:hypothetical protein